jgi:hypothetical protein
MVNTYETVTGSVEWDKVKGQVTQLVKSTSAYQNNLFGVVSDNYADFNSSGYNIKPEDNPKSIALVGRVLVKVSSENGVVQAGDYLTSSATLPGYAMKATRPGLVIGQALSSMPEGATTGLVMTFVHTSYYDPGMLVDDSGNVQLQRGNASTTLFAETDTASAYAVNQKGSGDLLQLQASGMDRLLVKNDGTIKVNITPADQKQEIVAVSSGTQTVFTINARGDAAITGVILVKDDTFAGSIATDAAGEANITFSYDLGMAQCLRKIRNNFSG